MTHLTGYLQKEIEINEQEKEVRIELDQVNSDLNDANIERKDLVSSLDTIKNDINNIDKKGIEITTEEFVRKSELVKEELRLTELINDVEDRLTDLYVQKKDLESKIIDFNEQKKHIKEEIEKKEAEAKSNLIEGVVIKESEINAKFEKTPSLKPLAGSDVSGKILQTQMRAKCPNTFNMSNSLKNNINELPQVKCIGKNEEKRNEYIKKINKEKMFEELEKLNQKENSNNKEVANIKSFVEKQEEKKTEIPVEEPKKEEIKVEIAKVEPKKEEVKPVVVDENKPEENVFMVVNPIINKVASSTKEKVNKIVSVYSSVSPLSDTKEIIKDDTGKIVNISSSKGLLKQVKPIENNEINIPLQVENTTSYPINNESVNIFSNQNINSFKKVV